MATRRDVLKAPLAALPLALPAIARADDPTQLVVWHDMGDPGTKWWNEISAAFAETHPGVSIRAISYPTDQWFGRVVGAINTDTAPDLIFNNYERVIRIANQTGKVMDLRPALDGINDKSFLGDDDLRVATFRDRMIILPVQRVQMGFGVRKSWLDMVGEPFPQTWDDAKRTAAKFQTGDAAGSGAGSVFGFALEAAKPRDLVHMLDLFTFGAGLRHTLLAPDGSITIGDPDHAKVLEEFLRIFSVYKLVPPDTINYSFNEMYQVIEGGRAGMFRVGDWNVAKWTTQGIKGDFVVGPWPKFFAGKQNAVVIGGMRGVAVPENSPHKDLAVQVATFLLGKRAQQASLKMVGSAVRTDLDTEGLTPQAQMFAQPKWSLIAYDFPESIHPWYPELEASFHRKLVGAIASPPTDYSAFIGQTALEMRDAAKSLAQKG
jgi:ABC-type glycerol-3-phosphate transport system substrate-binding protein